MTLPEIGSVVLIVVILAFLLRCLEIFDNDEEYQRVGQAVVELKQAFWEEIIDALTPVLDWLAERLD